MDESASRTRRPVKTFAAQDAVRLPDLDGNGADEIAVVAGRPADGKPNVFIKDTKTGALLRRIAW